MKTLLVMLQVVILLGSATSFAQMPGKEIARERPPSYGRPDRDRPTMQLPTEQKGAGPQRDSANSLQKEVDAANRVITAQAAKIRILEARIAELETKK